MISADAIVPCNVPSPPVSLTTSAPHDVDASFHLTSLPPGSPKHRPVAQSMAQAA